MDTETYPASHPVTAWDRVKAALQRDWEQTRSDLSRGHSGVDLNQDAGDTLAQAAGKAPLPMPGTPNPLDADELHDKVAKAQRQLHKAERRFEREGQRAAQDWQAAERAVRYGYLSASDRREPWNATIEEDLRGDYLHSWPDATWDDDVEAIRFGWDRAYLGV